MKRSFLLCVLVSFVVTFIGCGNDNAEKADAEEQEPKHRAEVNGHAAVIDSAANAGEAKSASRSSRESVEELLAGMGVRTGVDAEKERIIVVETRSIPVKGEERDESSEIKESYDFPDDKDDDFETRRFKTAWKAYADGLARIAEHVAQKDIVAKQIGGEVSAGEEKRQASTPGSILTQVSTFSSCSSSQQSLDGVFTLITAESFNGAEYEVTVAVCQSEKRKRLFMEYIGTGNRSDSANRLSLKEWIDQRASCGIICPQAYVDNEGVGWRVAGVPVEVKGQDKSKINARIERAKMYAFYAAMDTMSVDVSSRRSFSSVHNRGETEGAAVRKLEREVKIKPLCKVSPSDVFRVKWLDIKTTSPVTGRGIMVVCAIREDPVNVE